MTKRRLVVIGHGMVAAKLVDGLVARGATRTWEVTVLGEERHPAYDRVHLSSLFRGATAADLELTGATVAADPAVTVVTGESVLALDRQEKEVVTDAGRRIPYDVAVLATGSRALVPPVPGHDLPGCFAYRTIADVDAMRSWARGRAHGVVVGGGLLGLEAADALRSCGLAVEIVELSPWLMPAQVDQAGGELLGRRVEALGLAVHTGTTLASVSAGTDGAVRAVELSVPDSPPENLVTEMVVFAAGIRPRDELARNAGLELGPRGGILVDDQCRTSDRDVFAVGECASIGGRIHGLVAPGYQMARVAAEVICGGDAAFDAGDTPTKLKLLGVDVASFGDVHARTEGSAVIAFTDAVALVHKRLVVSDSGELLGGVLVGDATGFEELVAVSTGDAEPAEDPSHYLLGSGRAEDGSGPARSGGVSGLRDTATICSCENVSKGQICAVVAGAIAEGTSPTAESVKDCTRAGTGCGGCLPQVNELIRAGLADAGLEVSRRLCEHFENSRQELYDIIRISGIRTFSELLARHGRGRGCEICKPAVASILATVNGQYILDGEGAAIQDTNDHFLANMQKDGTYSVVPRVPGGEITPEKLIVLGEVARDFGLYTKVTGGQRIDMFGAKVDDLPAIWARLVDAGFESGHAYGKAMRTVKSCVGTNWCRFGVQDSTGLAVDLELRYRGLRSPHKLKLAVSGCARECAEARSKDVGVIATERGWNLYVCGNGGTRPRHADLLAEDLDAETLIRSIDRFLMFYVRTADRLQRTASWLEAMEGGIDHLRRVVMEDSLGLAEDLEEDMARHVASYRCEWAETLADPVRLRRFRSFVNRDIPDPDIVMVEERGQLRPAQSWERVELTGRRR